MRTAAATALAGAVLVGTVLTSGPASGSERQAPPASAGRVTAASGAATPATTTTTSYPAFAYSVRRVTRTELGASWHRGCPVLPRRLRAVRVSFVRFDRTVRHGTLIVHRDAVPAVVHAFRAMYRARFPMRRIRPVTAYGADDDASMAANNTSAFNCRRATGSTSWSQHAYGRAVDVNPIQNPYVNGSVVEPPAGKAYLDRSWVRRGMAEPGNAPVRGFAYSGWGWGGRWRSLKDYMHFSATGT